MYLLVQQVRQAATLAQLHLDVQVAALLPGPVLSHDVPVCWHGRQALYLLEAAAAAGHFQTAAGRLNSRIESVATCHGVHALEGLQPLLDGK